MKVVSEGCKMAKKISFQMEHKFVQDALLLLIRAKKITYSEAMIYNYMRSRSFKKKKICLIDHKYIAKILNIHKNKVLEKIKRLERIGMLEPIYIVKFQGQEIKFSTYAEAVRRFSLSAIKYKNYYIKPVPGEQKLIKEYKKK